MYNISFRDKILSEHFVKNTPFIDFNASFNYKASPFLRFNGSAGMTNRIGDIMDFIRGEIRKSYNTAAVSASGVLEHNQARNARLGYEYRHTMNGIFSSIDVLYSKTQRNIINGSDISENGSISTSAKDTKYFSDNFSGSLTFSKSLQEIKTVLSLNSALSYSANKRMRQNVITPYTNRSVMLEPKINFGYFERFSLICRGNALLSKLTTGTTVNDNETYSFNAEMTGLIVKNLELYYNLTYADNPVSANKRERLWFMDCGARYQPVRALELELTLYNLADIRYYNRIMYYETDVVETSYPLRPVTVLVSLKYRF
jgi:hypothetical protein